MNKNRKSKSVQAIIIKSIQANSLYTVNNYVEDENKTDSKKPYLDLGKAVINNGLFSDYMMHHAVAVNKKGRNKDLILSILVDTFYTYGIHYELVYRLMDVRIQFRKHLVYPTLLFIVKIEAVTSENNI